jgi:hypothetical protein
MQPIAEISLYSNIEALEREDPGCGKKKCQVWDILGRFGTFLTATGARRECASAARQPRFEAIVRATSYSTIVYTTNISSRRESK